MQIKRAKLKARIYFWLTCWRPVIKYEQRKNWEFIMKFCVAVEQDHIRFQKDIAALQKQVGVKKENKENTERGMYE